MLNFISKYKLHVELNDIVMIIIIHILIAFYAKSR